MITYIFLMRPKQSKMTKEVFEGDSLVGWSLPNDHFIPRVQTTKIGWIINGERYEIDDDGKFYLAPDHCEQKFKIKVTYADDPTPL